MYLADYHVHSTCSQDGRQTMAQAAQAAVAAGMDELCLTDHVDTIYWGPEQKPRWDFDWDAVRRQFRQAQEQWGHRITLRLGAFDAECPSAGLCHRLRPHGGKEISPQRPLLY